MSSCWRSIFISITYSSLISLKVCTSRCRTGCACISSRAMRVVVASALPFSLSRMNFSLSPSAGNEFGFSPPDSSCVKRVAVCELLSCSSA